jgi:carboxyl-terminal processing protease
VLSSSRKFSNSPDKLIGTTKDPIRSGRRVRLLTYVLSCLLISFMAHHRLSANERMSPENSKMIEEINRILIEHFYKKISAENFFEEKNIDRSSIHDFINERLRSLSSSHTALFTKDTIDYYELLAIYAPTGIQKQLDVLYPPNGVVTYPGIGIVPRIFESKTFIAYVYNGSPAANAGLLVGDEIVDVDGHIFHPIKSFEGKAAQNIDLTIRRHADSTPISFTVPVIDIRASEMLLDATRASFRVVSKGDQRFGYLRLWSYHSDNIETMIADFLTSEPMKDVDGLILDLRCRWGGAPPDAAEQFIGQSPVMTMIDRDGKETTINPRWRKPLVVIVDGGTRSGMEVLAYSLKKVGVRLVGARTAGSVVAGKAFLLSDNSLLLLATADVRVDGERLEGVGVTPDINISYDFRYAAGNDPQLDAAIAEIARTDRR